MMDDGLRINCLELRLLVRVQVPAQYFAVIWAASK